MFYVAQLVYVYSGKETTFHRFEDVAIPLIAKYGGQLLLRIRPNAETVVGWCMRTISRSPTDAAGRIDRSRGGSAPPHCGAHPSNR
jgi:hypothetical protein